LKSFPSPCCQHLDNDICIFASLSVSDFPLIYFFIISFRRLLFTTAEGTPLRTPYRPRTSIPTSSRSSSRPVGIPSRPISAWSQPGPANGERPSAYEVKIDSWEEGNRNQTPDVGSLKNGSPLQGLRHSSSLSDEGAVEALASRISSLDEKVVQCSVDCKKSNYETKLAVLKEFSELLSSQKDDSSSQLESSMQELRENELLYRKKVLGELKNMSGSMQKEIDALNSTCGKLQHDVRMNETHTNEAKRMLELLQKSVHSEEERQLSRDQEKRRFDTDVESHRAEIEKLRSDMEGVEQGVSTFKAEVAAANESTVSQMKNTEESVSANLTRSVVHESNNFNRLVF